MQKTNQDDSKVETEMPWHEECQSYHHESAPCYVRKPTAMERQIQVVITLKKDQTGTSPSKINIQSPPGMDSLQLIGLLHLAAKVCAESVEIGEVENEN